MGFVRQRDLEDRFGKAKIIQLFDEDGDGNIDLPGDQQILVSHMADADDAVESYLLKAWTRDQIAKLFDDNQLRRQAACICMQLAGERKTEWLNAATGKGQYENMGERARGILERIAAGELRTRKEATSQGAGENPTLDADLSLGTPNFVFARNANDPNDKVGKGGF